VLYHRVVLCSSWVSSPPICIGMWGRPWVIPECHIFVRHLLDFLEQSEDNKGDAPTIRMDCHPILTNWRPNLCHAHHFTLDALPGTTLPIYPGLGRAPNMLACISGIVRGRLYSSCVQSSMLQCNILLLLHGSETWPIRKENEVTLQPSEMIMVRWMCGINQQYRVPCKGLRERETERD